MWGHWKPLVLFVRRSEEDFDIERILVGTRFELILRSSRWTDNCQDAELYTYFQIFSDSLVYANKNSLAAEKRREKAKHCTRVLQRATHGT
jgi:hypothetical protein